MDARDIQSDIAARWAHELTRANQLEAALRKAEHDRDDWQRIALENGERAARAEVDRARHTANLEIWARRNAEHQKQFDAALIVARGAMVDWIDAATKAPYGPVAMKLGWLEQWMRDDEIGDLLTTECGECLGLEYVVDDPADGKQQCRSCVGGRVAVEA